MKKKSIHFVVYLLGVFVFIVWIFFLFSQSELNRGGLKSGKQSQHRSDAISGTKYKEELETLTPDFSDDFLEQKKDYSIGTLNQIDNLKEKIEFLEEVFKENPSLDVAELLINSYLLDYQFDQAKRFYVALPVDIKNSLPKGMAFKIGINAFSQTSLTEYENLKKLLKYYQEDGTFSAEESLYYATVFLLIDERYEDAKPALQKLYESKYRSFAVAVNDAFTKYTSLKSVPAYYQDGLIAYQLMQFGFLGGAKKMMLPLVNTNPDYILPYQILAQVEFMMGKWEASAGYFHHLLEIDYQSKSLYLYHLGVAYYHLKRYSDAILYLAQISDQRIMLDSDRYLILSYIAMGQEEKALAGWKRLAGYASIKKSDFYSFFEHTFREPYRLGKSSLYFKKDPKLVGDYLALCAKKLVKEDQAICAYGQLGLRVYKGDLLSLENEALRFARRSPKSEFFQLVGQVAQKKGEYEKATTAFMRALNLTENPAEKNYLKKLILEVNELEG